MRSEVVAGYGRVGVERSWSCSGSVIIGIYYETNWSGKKPELPKSGIHDGTGFHDVE